MEYSYQPHQIAFTDRKGLDNCTRLKTRPEDVMVAHFSALPKPSHLVVDRNYGPDQTDGSEWYGPERNVSVEQFQFANTEMLEAYEKGRLQNRNPNSQPSRLNPSTIDAQRRACTAQLGTDWFVAWNEVREHFPDVKQLVRMARGQGPESAGGGGDFLGLADMPAELTTCCDKAGRGQSRRNAGNRSGLKRRAAK